jgi:phage baseplate assembly protein V
MLTKTDGNVRELIMLMQNIIKVGRVVDLDPVRCTAKVQFSDADEIVSYDLPLIVTKSEKDKFYHMPDIDEQVICLFLPNGMEQGFILGSFYSKADTPPISDPDVHMTKYSDGTTIKYDRKNHKLTADVKGTADINTDGQTTVTAPTIIINTEQTHNGNISVNGNITVSGNIGVGGNVSMSGLMTSSAATVNGIEFNTHKHTGIEPGSGTSDGPTS